MFSAALAFSSHLEREQPMKAHLVNRVVSVMVIALAVVAWSCGRQTTSPPAVEQGSSTTPTASTATATSLAAVAPSESSSGVTTEITDSTTTVTAPETTAPPRPDRRVSSEGEEFPPPPDFPQGPISEELAADLDAFFDLLESERRIGEEELVAVAGHGDIRTAWILTDVLRFSNSLDLYELLGSRLQVLLGDDAQISGGPELWKETVDLLIAWDLPAFPGYPHYKGRIFTLVEPGWEPFFADSDATIDCIPALDDPPVTPADQGDWYPDDAVVFGVTIGGETRAYPKNQMEVHEMVNDTLGGRRIGMPYCTLCGSAQAYFTDQVPEGVEPPTLRTSGLLSRSNKVMYDLNTWSVLDTFTGEAVSGPLREAGVRLAPTTLASSTWGAWKEAHPDTTILAEDGGLGRSYSVDPLGGRDDGGPIFPVGDVDPRLGVQELVVGVELEDGTAVAFPRQTALSVIDSGGEVTAGGVRLIKDGDGLRAVAVSDGSEIPAHQAFWFAWSQFWPDTLLWSPSPK